MNLTYATGEESSEQFGGGVRDIERDHEKEPLHVPVAGPNASENGENEGGERGYLERGGGGFIVTRGPVVVVVVVAVRRNVYRRVRLLEGGLARKRESAIRAAVEAEIAVDGTQRIHGWKRKENNGNWNGLDWGFGNKRGFVIWLRRE